MRSQTKPAVTFVTGTDTGVGKTVFTGHLVHYLRARGIHALAMKPFCSGGREDAEFLSAVQDHEVSLDVMNPFYFSQPLAPLMAAREDRRRISLKKTMEAIHAISVKCEHLVIEGAGGLLVPLGEGFSALDLIKRTRADVVVVAANRLGVINHTLLTMGALPRAMQTRARVVLVDTRESDLSSAGNGRMLKELLPGMPIIGWPYLGPGASTVTGVKKNFKKIQKTLAPDF
jgi:dethiobiotin synthetase